MLVIAVAGPTGSGKSELGLAIAEAFKGEIVNYDSVQVYRGLDIGSAKLPASARRGIPHHLIDVLDPIADLTAGAYARMARGVLTEVWGRGRLPILVGGTGFYLRALLDGLSPAPERDPKLRSRLAVIAVRRPGALHRFLRCVDPDAARRIHANDLQKLIRAIEMTTLAGRPSSVTQTLPRHKLEGFSVLKLGLAPDRAQLRDRLNTRAIRMFEQGLVEETRRLLNNGVPANTKALQSLGYKQALAVLSGATSVEHAIAESQARTRQYAKRQFTWFRADPEVHWLHGFGAEPGIQQEALRQVASFLGVG
ncbi:MAG: tRNA (adenosine(37)-N6)-dimethylallyltransferase MiaA [Acidobacteriaceae bacterium]|nr:tRNA (adenosine(37)-N6)-dimethylallyltransferase MiaA [Acidobacteriaceae bacterium]